MPLETCWMSYYKGIEIQRRQSAYARKLLKKQGFVPRVIVTDKLKSYAAAKKQVLKGVEHRYSQGLEQPLRKLSRLRHSGDRDECGNSNPLGKRNDFSPLLDQFETTFIRNNTSSLLTAIANSCANDFVDWREVALAETCHIISWSATF